MSDYTFSSGSTPPAGTGPRANFGLRLVGAIIDGVILFIASFIFRTILGLAGSGLAFLAGLAYYIYLEGSPSGQTVGKKVMNIRVIDLQSGGPIGYGRAAVRYFGRWVSAIPCALGYFWMLWDGQKQCWHDKFSSDVVVPTADYPVAAWPG